MGDMIYVSREHYERLVRIAQEVLACNIAAESRHESIEEWLDFGQLCHDIRETLPLAHVEKAYARAVKITTFED